MPQMITREVLTSGKLCHSEKMTAEGRGHGPREEVCPLHLHRGQRSTSPNVPKCLVPRESPCCGSGDSSTVDDDIGHMRGGLTHTTPIKHKPQFFWKMSKESLATVRGSLLSRREELMKTSRVFLWLRDARPQAPPPGRPRPQEAGPHEAQEGSGSHPPAGQSAVGPGSFLPCPRQMSEVPGPQGQSWEEDAVLPQIPESGGHCPGVPPTPASPTRRYVPLRCRDVSTPSTLHTT